MNCLEAAKLVTAARKVYVKSHFDLDSRLDKAIRQAAKIRDASTKELTEKTEYTRKYLNGTMDFIEWCKHRDGNVKPAQEVYNRTVEEATREFYRDKAEAVNEYQKVKDFSLYIYEKYKLSLTYS